MIVLRQVKKLVEGQEFAMTPLGTGILVELHPQLKLLSRWPILGGCTEYYSI